MNKIRKAKYIAVIIFLVSISGCVSRVAIKADYDFTKIKRIGVLSFIDYGEQKGSGEAVADEFIRQLIRKDLVVIERIQLENILKEQDLSSSGYMNPQTIKKAGELLGVDVIITGTVTKYLPEDKYVVLLGTKTKTVKITEFSDVERKNRKKIKTHERKEPQLIVVNAEVGISARMIDVQTGTIVWANSYTYDAFDIETAMEWTVSDLLWSLRKVWPQINKKS